MAVFDEGGSLSEAVANGESNRFPGEANPRLTGVRGQAIDLGRRAGNLRLCCGS